MGNEKDGNDFDFEQIVDIAGEQTVAPDPRHIVKPYKSNVLRSNGNPVHSLVMQSYNSQAAGSFTAAANAHEKSQLSRELVATCCNDNRQLIQETLAALVLLPNYDTPRKGRADVVDFFAAASIASPNSDALSKLIRRHAGQKRKQVLHDTLDKYDYGSASNTLVENLVIGIEELKRAINADIERNRKTQAVGIEGPKNEATAESEDSEKSEKARAAEYLATILEPALKKLESPELDGFIKRLLLLENQIDSITTSPSTIGLEDMRKRVERIGAPPHSAVKAITDERLNPPSSHGNALP